MSSTDALANKMGNGFGRERNTPACPRQVNLYHQNSQTISSVFSTAGAVSVNAWAVVIRRREQHIFRIIGRIR